MNQVCSSKQGLDGQKTRKGRLLTQWRYAFVARGLRLLPGLAMLFVIAGASNQLHGAKRTTPQSQDAPPLSELSGQWVGRLEQMKNGEYNQLTIEMRQHGNVLQGLFHTRGYGSSLRGTIKSGSFELFRDDRPNKYIYGNVVGRDLHVFFYEHPVTLHPISQDDIEPAPAYLAPPALHRIAANGLAKTPPMGWNSWNQFKERVDDATIRSMADAMVSSGMRDAGYVYLNIDDTWEGVRDGDGVLQPNHAFPDMKALAQYVHARGLKLGIYSSPGTRTCAGYPGSYGHEAIDAKTWASWGIDYVKYDWCSAGEIYKKTDMHAIYQKMGDALVATGRPMVYSLCQYGEADVQTWGADVGGNLWRTTADIRDTWDSMSANGFSQDSLAPYAAPGHWNDPDMLEVGNGRMSDDEYMTHMSLWSLLAAPLLAGNDIRSMPPSTKAVLLNRDVIEVDQDALGKQANRIVKDGSVEIWTKPLQDGSVAVGIFNRGDKPQEGRLQLGNLKLNGPLTGRDLWANRRVTFDGDFYSVMVPSHGVNMLRISATRSLR